MTLGIITGSGTYALSALRDAESASLDTPYGPVRLTRGTVCGHAVIHLARHGEGHARLSNSVNHRANVWALNDCGVDAVVGLTACGAVDPTLDLGSLVIFDDLHFPSNRLPEGPLCTFFDTPGDPTRAHWILHGGPYSPELVAVLTESAHSAALTFQAGGTYGHVDGPRFNTPSEIAQLAACGVAAVSQTGGPETVLCGELGLPFALVGFVTDYANEVIAGEPTPVSTLSELMGRSSSVFERLLDEAVGRLAALPAPPKPAGTVFRIGDR